MSSYPVRSTLSTFALSHPALAGEIIVDGMDFRNSAHFRFKADLFVPCGGRSVYVVARALYALMIIQS